MLPMIQLAGFDLIWVGILVVLLVEIAEGRREVCPGASVKPFVLSLSKDDGPPAR
ncbi:hypothetical protein ACFQOZ_19285 [Comamonas endophytica]|uniref:hypothetical protein n=1 Tax=Comamonas endophytica TaxID=2949090 RepID=UPI0036119267